MLAARLGRIVGCRRLGEARAREVGEWHGEGAEGKGCVGFWEGIRSCDGA